MVHCHLECCEEAQTWVFIGFYSMKLLLFVYNSQSGALSGWSKQLFWRAECSSESENRVAGLMVVVVCKVTFGLSKKWQGWAP